MKPFEIEVQHSAETVSDLTRAQYALSHKTARLIQVVTAVVCLLIGGWHDLSVGYSGMKKRLARKFGSEYDDYADEELYE
mgnify:CR=1 FL=1